MNKRITISRKRLERLLEIERRFNKQNKKWSLEEDEYLVLAHFDGESKLVDIAKFLGRTTASVAQRMTMLRKNGMVAGRMGGWSDKDICFLKSAHGRITNKNIAEKLGKSESAIQHKVNELGIAKTKRVDIQEIHRLANQGMTRRQISAHIGCHYDTIKRLVRKHRIVVKNEDNLFKKSHNEFLAKTFSNY